MALKIRLSRAGAKKRPYYHIVIAEGQSPRDGKFIERVGHFNPILPSEHAERIKVDVERCKHWLSVGAQPTDRVARFLDAAGLLKRTVRHNPEKLKPRKKTVERAAAQAKVAADLAAKAAAETPAT
jgi:small subunit ribosomal protein S16